MPCRALALYEDANSNVPLILPGAAAYFGMIQTPQSWGALTNKSTKVEPAAGCTLGLRIGAVLYVFHRTGAVYV